MDSTCLLRNRYRPNRLSKEIIAAVSILVFLSFFNCSLAQTINFEDGFEDGNLSANPAWSGDTTNFVVSKVISNSLLQLHGDSESGGVSFLSVPSTNTVGYWEFYIALNGFSPSDGNRAEIFLMSDRADLKAPVNGYALRAGENGSNDVFRIVRYENGIAAATVLSGTTNISGGGAYRIKISRDSGGKWILAVADTYAGNPIQEGEAQIDNTFSVTAFFGLKVTYSATRYDKFSFDFKIDLPPFAVEKISSIGNSLDLKFNRAYDPGTVQNSNFVVDNGVGSPNSISFLSEKSLRLFYEREIPSDKYILVLNNIEDENGESIAPNTELGFIKYGAINTGEVVINEFMFDPPFGLPEYIELKNRSSKFLNMIGWQLGDQSGIRIITTDTLALEPGGFIVLSPDTAALFNRFGSRNYLQIGSGNFPTLNNSGDAIRILGQTNNVIDSLFYLPDWGGEDVALERRSDKAPSTKKSNWGDSPDGTGTPGFENLIDPDLEAPQFTDVKFINPGTLLLLFNEELAPASATKAANYTIQPNPGIQLISSIDDTVLINLKEDLQSLQTYSITVSGLEDIFGNAMNTETQELRFVNFSAVGPSDIVINELLYIPAVGGVPEFIELYNLTDKNFDLSEWIIGDAAGTATLPMGAELLADGYLVLTKDADFSGTINNGLFVPNFPSLNNSGDIVFLRSPQNHVIDSLNYASYWGGDKTGHSLERMDPYSASNDPSNWSTGKEATGNTAGTRNSVYQPDLLPPVIIFAKEISGNLIQVQFNEFITLTPDLTFHLDNTPLSVREFHPSRANSILLEPFSAKTKFSSKILRGSNLSDIKGNISEAVDVPLAQELKPGDLVVNEIMYNPLSNSEDNIADQSEYIELRNIRDYAVSLEGISIHDAPDENNEIRSLLPVNTEYRWVPAQGVVLIYADEEPIFGQSKTARFFGLADEGVPNALRIDRSTLSLASTGDAVFLTNYSGITIDSVFYGDSWHNPNLLDTRGIALERISPTGPGNDASNWSSSIGALGGTPGSENSIYQLQNESPVLPGISFSPNPFSPDDDGNDDHLFINYKLDEPDYLLKARIYDRYGRLVRMLANGQPAGFEGSLIWDGRKNDGSSNRIGIYIVVLEAFNSAQGKNMAFKKTLVLARRLQ